MKYRKAMAVFSAACLLVIASNSPAYGQEATDREPDRETVRDARLYAEVTGESFDKVLAELVYQREVEQILGELEANGEIDEMNLAGAEFIFEGEASAVEIRLRNPDAPGREVSSEARRDMQQKRDRIVQTLERRGLALSASVRASADFSDHEMRVEQERLDSELRRSGRYESVITTIRDRDQTIEVKAVRAEAPLRSRPTEARAQSRGKSSDAPAVEAVELPAGTDIGQTEAIIGGSQLWGTRCTNSNPNSCSFGQQCTAAFTARRNTTGRAGVLTAQHCFENTGITKIGNYRYGTWLIATYMRTTHYGTYGDAGFLETSLQGSADNPSERQHRATFWDGRWNHNVESVIHYSSFVLNAKVFNYGQTSNSQSSGIVKSRNVTHNGAGSLVQVEGLNLDTEQGDSGGPWWSGRVAYGIHHGSTGGALAPGINGNMTKIAWFTKAKHAEIRTGTTIITQ